ncbi:hypothetical protein ACOMHN_042306 [Nucella lapillus]
MTDKQWSTAAVTSKLADDWDSPHRHSVVERRTRDTDHMTHRHHESPEAVCSPPHWSHTGLAVVFPISFPFFAEAEKNAWGILDGKKD